MKLPMPWLPWLLLLAGLPGLAVADEGERARIAAERQALIARFALEERECLRRFAVTACIDDVGNRRRAALAPLRALELQLDDAARQQRAADRRAAIEAKQRRQAAREAAGKAAMPLPAPPGSAPGR